MQQKKVCRPTTGLLPELTLSVRNITKWSGISKNMGRAIQGKPAETDAKENGKIARVFKGAFKVEGALISSINRNAEWALNTLARLEQTAERHPSVLEAMREQAAKTEPAKKQPAPSHDKESR